MIVSVYIVEYFSKSTRLIHFSIVTKNLLNSSYFPGKSEVFLPQVGGSPAAHLGGRIIEYQHLELDNWNRPSGTESNASTFACHLGVFRKPNTLFTESNLRNIGLR